MAGLVVNRHCLLQRIVPLYQSNLPQYWPIKSFRSSTTKQTSSVCNTTASVRYISMDGGKMDERRNNSQSTARSRPRTENRDHKVRSNGDTDATAGRTQFASPAVGTGSNVTRLASPTAHDHPAYSGRIEPIPLEDIDTLAQILRPPRPNYGVGLEAIDNTAPKVISEISHSESTASATSSRGSSDFHAQVFEDVAELRNYRASLAQRGHIVGFVPTMGALHQGHLDLMIAAAQDCHEVWVSIYVNPTQFGANEDLSTYPSTWAEDTAKIEKLNQELRDRGLARITTIFKPRNAEVLYPFGVDGTSHVIINPELTQILEGASRPTFFRGVTTVVMKLLNIVQPERVYFGQKDIQQFAVIKRMIKEFHLPVRIQRVATRREESGLAMSSRNAYLGSRRRQVAPVLHRMLTAAKEAFDDGPSEFQSRSNLIAQAMQEYEAEQKIQAEKEAIQPGSSVQFHLDYLSLADPDTLQEIPDLVGPRGAVMSLAVYMEGISSDSISAQEKQHLGIDGDQGRVRLIDNMLFGVDRADV